jgi:hypothetical protein
MRRVRVLFRTYPDTPLADARKEREKARQDLAHDINPADARRNANAPERTFEAVARHWLAKLAKKVRLGKRSLKTLKKATWAFETYVFTGGVNPATRQR